MTRAARAVAAALLLALVACGSAQDPGMTVETPDGDGPGTTSSPLPACPDGGPDETTPPAGCLGPDGQVLRP